ncbi:MAG TPA: hypothetical protein DD435_01640 [Cyanobacteria bacterium UBA8530]|nr:hypothetical protein [Cyanobacteria bacterium UBA8530]
MLNLTVFPPDLEKQASGYISGDAMRAKIALTFDKTAYVSQGFKQAPRIRVLCNMDRMLLQWRLA